MITEALSKIKGLRVLFVGETIIDEYNYALPLGKTPKEHMIATQFQSKERFTGGIVAAAHHLDAFCDHVRVSTNGEPHIVKSRYVDPTYNRKLFEIAYLPETEILADWRDSFYIQLQEALPNYDSVIAIDYGHGLIDQRTADLISYKSNYLAVNTQTNSANYGFNIISKYKRADLVCLDALEARLAVRDNFATAEETIEALPAVIHANHYIITHGKNGCVTMDMYGKVTSIPTGTQKVTDTMGAGDAFLSIAAPLLAVGLDIETAAKCGNIAGGMKTNIIGHRAPIDKDAFMEAINAIA